MSLRKRACRRCSSRRKTRTKPNDSGAIPKAAGEIPECAGVFFQRQSENENADHHNSGLRPATGKPVERVPLENLGGSENPNWYAAARRFEIEFIVHSVRPADADGFSTKAATDFLVKIGILPEDRWDVVVKSSISSRKAATEGEERTEVIISTVE